MQQLAETYAAEISVLYVHRLGGRRSILQTSANPFALSRRLSGSLVGAALTVESPNGSLDETFGTVGVRARENGLPDHVLVGDVGELLATVETYLSHTAPALFHATGWTELWLALNESVVRAAVYGYTKRALSVHASVDTDAHLPPMRRLRRAMFPEFTTDPVEAVCSASKRLDLDIDAVIGTDTSGTIICWNATAEAKYGLSEDETIGRNVLDITPAVHSRSRSEEILRAAAEGNPWSGPFTVRHASGRPLQVVRTDMPVQHKDQILGVIGLRRFA